MGLLAFFATNRAVLLKVGAGVLALLLLASAARWGYSHYQQDKLRDEQAAQNAEVYKQRVLNELLRAQVDAPYHESRGRSQALQPTLDTLKKQDEALTRRLPAVPRLPARR